ncbi:MAG: hypothetical protein ACYTG1_09720 [Planctomycetota bacterium]|jgi:hypothetical protein
MDILLGCDDIWQQLIDKNDFMGFVAITIGCTVGVIGILAGTTSSIMKTRAREATRRELAAYVAEGSLDPDKAVAMLSAGVPKWERSDFDVLGGGRKA